MIPRYAAQRGTMITKKTEGRKSRDTVSLRCMVRKGSSSKIGTRTVCYTHRGTYKARIRLVCLGYVQARGLILVKCFGKIRLACSEFTKGTVTRDFCPSVFFHQSTPPRALIHGLRPFNIFRRIRRENR
jgi:hypothetical protein